MVEKIKVYVTEDDEGNYIAYIEDENGFPFIIGDSSVGYIGTEHDVDFLVDSIKDLAYVGESKEDKDKRDINAFYDALIDFVWNVPMYFNGGWRVVDKVCWGLPGLVKDTFYEDEQNQDKTRLITAIVFNTNGGTVLEYKWISRETGDNIEKELYDIVYETEGELPRAWGKLEKMFKEHLGDKIKYKKGSKKKYKKGSSIKEGNLEIM